jgi:NADH-quinone oxidoreductase subunit N
MRILTFAFPGVAGERTALLMALSLLTMSVGNLMAIPQRNIKRLMGYSAIANAGYILIGVAAGESGLPAVVFCLTVYGVTNIAAFGVISLVSNVVGSDRLEAYTALNRRSSTLALALLAALLSLGGIPPLGGFMAKLFLFMAGVRSGLTWLVVAGLLNTILGLYYYLNVARILYRDPEGAVRDPIPIPRSSKVVITLSTGALVALGILAAPVYQIILSLFERWAQ